MSFAGRPARLLLRDCVAAIAILGVSLVLYAVILKLFLVLSRTSIIYIQLFLHPADLFDQPAQVAVRVLGQMNDIYFGRQSVYGYKSPIIIVFIVLAAGGVIYHAYRTAGPKGGFFGGLTILALLTVPFAMNLMSGGIMPVRSLVAVPVALTSLGLLGFKYGPQWLARIGMIVLTLSCFYILKSLSGFNAAQELVQLHDRLMALALSERIASVAGPTEPGKPLTLDVFGFKSFQTPFPRIANSTVGASFFEWDRGNPDRIVTYMKLIGLPTFKVVAPERRIKFLDEFVMMPAWPAGGSVRAAADGTILGEARGRPEPILSRAARGQGPICEGQRSSIFSPLDGYGKVMVSAEYCRATTERPKGSNSTLRYDPQFIFRIGASGTAENCRRIELHTRLRSNGPRACRSSTRSPAKPIFRTIYRPKRRFRQPLMVVSWT